MSLKIGIFVDIQNQVEAMSSSKKGHRLNYKKYLEFIASLDDSLLWKKNAYGIYLTDEGISFIQLLTHFGYRPSFIKAKYPGEVCSRSTEITLDVIDAHQKLDIVVLGSNSPELIPLINWLQMRSVKVWQVTPQICHQQADWNVDLLKDENTVVEHINVLKAEDHGSRSGNAQNDPERGQLRNTPSGQATPGGPQ